MTDETAGRSPLEPLPPRREPVDRLGPRARALEILLGLEQRHENLYGPMSERDAKRYAAIRAVLEPEPETEPDGYVLFCEAASGLFRAAFVEQKLSNASRAPAGYKLVKVRAFDFRDGEVDV